MPLKWSYSVGESNPIHVAHLPVTQPPHIPCSKMVSSETHSHLVQGLNYNRCAMLLCCRCVWLPPIIFIGTHSFALVMKDKYSANLCFLYEKMCAMDGFPTIDTSHTHELRIFLAQLHSLVSVETVT
ncbi:hypothetical protein SFRURICE_017647 [Spodoptera frugiperda]|nr:hypothetical protein SFRURICE_017647 [Spodoptera frugiperda]